MDEIYSEACVLLGSNVSPEIHLPKAISLLGERVNINRVSKAWESFAVGSDGPNFVNAAILVSTNKNPHDLKFEDLRQVEKELGRIRNQDKYSPRTIDLDIVIWNNEFLDENLWEFAYLAVPVSEILPEVFSQKIGETLKQCAQRLCTNQAIWIKPDIFSLIPL